VLETAGIKIYNTEVCNISDVLVKYRAGELTEAKQADA